MTPTNKMRANVAAAVCAGLALRVYLVLKFPVTDTGDAPFYIELAWNWLKNGVYGFRGAWAADAGGYARAGVSGVSGGGVCFRRAIATCGDAGAGGGGFGDLLRDRADCGAARAGKFAAAGGAGGIVAGGAVPVHGELHGGGADGNAGDLSDGARDSGAAANRCWRRCQVARAGAFLANPWLLAGIVVGFGTLVRPETPLVLFAAGLVLLAKWWRPEDWPKLIRAGVLMGLGAADAAGAVGRAQLAHAARCAVSGAAVQRIAGRIYAAGIHGVDEHVDVAISATCI